VNGRVLLSLAGREYRNKVFYAVKKIQSHKFGKKRISLMMRAYPPDNRRRDLDNLLKSTIDSLQAAGVYDDDSQIDDLRIVRCETSKPGKLLVSMVAID